MNLVPLRQAVLALACLGLVVAAACSSRRPVPRYASIGYAEGALDGWAFILRHYVDEQGNVDYEGLKRSPEPLERYVTWIAYNGPELSPNRLDTREEQLAYYLNAYNALCMYNVVVSGNKPHQRWRFFKRSKLRIDGEYRSLSNIEKKLIRPLDEERVYFGLNPMAKGAPRLRREPFVPELVDDQLERAAVEFFNDPRYVHYEPDRDRVEMSRILKEHEREFEEAAPSLIAYANRYLANPLPEDVRVRFESFDWSLNAQAPR